MKYGPFLMIYKRHVYTLKGQVLDSISEEADVGVRMADTLKPGAQYRNAAKTADSSRTDHARIPL